MTQPGKRPLTISEQWADPIIRARIEADARAVALQRDRKRAAAVARTTGQRDLLTPEDSRN